MKGHTTLFSRASDNWGTPQELYDELDREFHFELDAAADTHNHKCRAWLGPGSHIATNALTYDWSIEAQRVWLNPPYSQCASFLHCAACQAKVGLTVVCLVPSRTDTRWFHDWVWDIVTNKPRPGVSIRFLKGRLKFTQPAAVSTQSAPFPSMLIIFRRP